MSDFLVVIPARLGSTRFPGKVLAALEGRPIVEWCRRAALEADIGPVIVATEEEAVARTLAHYGADVEMTSARCRSGSDRVYEAAKKRMARSTKYVMNLQGDEPLIRAETIRKVAQTLRKSKCDIATAVVPLTDGLEAHNPNCVKVAMSDDGRCHYFSRSAIPYGNGTGRAAYHKHIGIYAYKKEALKRFVSLPPSKLELRESLEQLRALEAGMTISAAVVEEAAIAIDVPSDLEKASRWIAQHPQGVKTHG